MRIRATHPYAFRSGQWAEVETVEVHPVTKRACWRVRFPQGGVDHWPVTDASMGYEFA